MRDSNILDSSHDQIPSGLTNINTHTCGNSSAAVANVTPCANLTGVSHGTCSALSNHVANISIANSLMSNSDSNVLHDERDGRESSCEASRNPSPRASNGAPHPPVAVCGPTQAVTATNCNSAGPGSTPSGYTCGGAVGGSGGNNNNNGNNNTSGVNNDSGTNTVNVSAGQIGNNNPSDLDNMVNYTSGSDRLRFHDKCGTLVKLSNSSRTAERRRPLDEFNNGVVMSSRALRENELFEVNFLAALPSSS